MTRSALRLGAVALSVLLAGAIALVFAWALEGNSYNLWGAVIVVPLLVAVNVVVIARVARSAPEPWLLALLMAAFGAKLVGALLRYFVAYVVYGGAADAERYNRYAATQHHLWRQGAFVWEWGGKQGTQYMELITTAVYTVIGPSPLAGFLVFATLAFWGQYLLLRAFRIALPRADGRRYAVLVMFLPSMLYWPSSIGKEAWLLLFVGVTALGAARLFAARSGAVVLLVIGAAGTTLVRPHITVLLFAALLVAQLFRPADDQPTGILKKATGVLVLGAAAWILASQSAVFLGTDDLSWQAISETVEATNGQTSQGGSTFTAVPVSSVWGMPLAVLTVLFRPFVWEAGNAQMIVQSLECLFLLGLTVRGWPRIRRLPGILRRAPYVVFCLVFTSAFIWAFSGFGNFGILSRQRVLMIPFFLVLLALPLPQPEAHPDDDDEFDDMDDVDPATSSKVMLVNP
ncbi:hypothetical protein JNB_05390 [Janibacter sp. HTCC2649]|uniref:hypothetical protein n=1 Tax=Janibacter sp. HTCC2649 TaxID=313589 RepID=UPI000066ED47|nr:hypothetical protein [Janibacter sp. HTCC2649]EAP99580.1 hypothetical protein JNB_05390 [Janibacter sp. HTCC2649]